MTIAIDGLARRRFIEKILKTMVWTAVSPWAAKAWSMGGLAGRSGVIAFEGQVQINGQPVQKELPVNPGDVVTTAAGSRLIFIIGKDVFLLREDTRLEIDARAITELGLAAGQAMRLVAGKVLTVWGRGRRRFETPTALVAVRGTGIYFEAEPQRAYICTCYGVAEIVAKGAADVKETVRTTHHESPRFVYADNADGLIKPAPVFNHTDQELTHLEFLVGRTPPFLKGTTY